MDLNFELKVIVRRLRPGLIGATRNPNLNLKQILEDFKRKPKFVEQLRQQFEAILLTRDFVPALTEVGLSQQSGVFGELFKRVEYKILPQAQEPNDVLGLIQQVFGQSGDEEWFDEIQDDLLREFLAQILPERSKMVDRLVSQLFYSLEILSLRLASVGLEPLVKSRLKERSEYLHAFVEVPRSVQKFLESRAESSALYQQLQLVDQAAGYIRGRRAEEGISLGLTFQLIRIHELTRRMRLILKIIDAALENTDSAAALDLFRQIVKAQIEKFNLLQYLGKNVSLLAYQITEHTSKTGEHYITSSRSEYFGMLKAAMIGGFVVAMLAFMKIFISYINLAPALAAVAFGLLYAVGFVFIHTIGGVLATKQPAMTAAYLAQALDSTKNSATALQNLCEVIVRTIRTQLIALLGNFLIAFPVGLAIGYGFYYVGLPIVSVEKANHLLESSHPFHSLSFMYAAIAGVCLFVSGLIAGFASNWFQFNKVGSRLKQSPLFKGLFRGKNHDRVINSIESNVGIWSGNISLGFFLGTMPSLGAIFGLPIDIRHITFMAATFGGVVGTLGLQVSSFDMVMVTICVLTVGLINLAVSFSLSLFLAINSRGIKFSQSRELMGLVLNRFLRRPWEFILPPSSASAASSAGHK